MTANGRHLKLSGRRGTPPDWVEMSRVALGGRIELDPMSEEIFNQIVRAERYFTEQDNALLLDWDAGTILLNPHGGLVVEAWRKLVAEWYTRAFEAIWIGFSMEQLNLLADEPIHPDDFSKLTVRGRIDFLTTEPMRLVVKRGEVLATLECGHMVEMTNAKQRKAKSVRCSDCQDAAPEPLGSPTHANYVVGLGIPRERFEAAFAGRGRFSHGRYAMPSAGVGDEMGFGGGA